MWPEWFHPELMRSPHERTVAMSEFIASKHGFTMDDIRGPSRKRPLFLARCEIARMMRARGRSLPSIGRFMNRDHSSIVNMLRRAG